MSPFTGCHDFLNFIIFSLISGIEEVLVVHNEYSFANQRRPTNFMKQRGSHHGPSGFSVRSYNGAMPTMPWSTNSAALQQSPFHYPNSLAFGQSFASANNSIPTGNPFNRPAQSETWNNSKRFKTSIGSTPSNPGNRNSFSSFQNIHTASAERSHRSEGNKRSTADNDRDLKDKICQTLRSCRDCTTGVKELCHKLSSQKKDINRVLYTMLKERIVDKIQDQPPVWKLINLSPQLHQNLNRNSVDIKPNITYPTLTNKEFSRSSGPSRENCQNSELQNNFHAKGIKKFDLKLPVSDLNPINFDSNVDRNLPVPMLQFSTGCYFNAPSNDETVKCEQKTSESSSNCEENSTCSVPNCLQDSIKQWQTHGRGRGLAMMEAKIVQDECRRFGEVKKEDGQVFDVEQFSSAEESLSGSVEHEGHRNSFMEDMSNNPNKLFKEKPKSSGSSESEFKKPLPPKQLIQTNPVFGASSYEKQGMSGSYDNCYMDSNGDSNPRSVGSERFNLLFENFDTLTVTDRNKCNKLGANPIKSFDDLSAKSALSGALGFSLDDEMEVKCSSLNDEWFDSTASNQQLRYEQPTLAVASLTSESFAAINKNSVSALMEYAQSRKLDVQIQCLDCHGPSHRPR